MKAVPRRVIDRIVRYFLDHGGKIANARDDLAALRAFAGYRSEDSERVLLCVHGLGLIQPKQLALSVEQLFLTPAGYSYFERRRDDRRKLLVNSLALPLLVSLVTAMVTVYILPRLGEAADTWMHSIRQWIPGS